MKCILDGRLTCIGCGACKPIRDKILEEIRSAREEATSSSKQYKRFQLQPRLRV